MSRYFSKGLIAAMEEGDLDGDISGDSTSQDAMNEVADISEEVSEDVVSVESMALAIEEAVEDAEQIEEVVDTVADVSESGGDEGLTEGEAVLAEEAFRQAFRRLGGSASQSVMPSLESFRSSNSRKAATRIALEGVVEKLKSIWRAIIEAIKKMFNKVKNLYKKFFNGNKSLKEAAKSLKDRVNKLKTSRTDEDEFENGGISKAFPEKKRINKDIISAAIAAHSGAISTIATNTSTLLSDFKVAADALAPAANAKTDNARLSTALSEFVSSKLPAKLQAIFGLKETLNFSFSGSSSEKENTSDAVFIGGKVTEVTYTASKEVEGDTEIYEYKLDYKFKEGDNVVRETEQKIEVGSKSEMSTICEAVSSLATTNMEKLKDLDKQEKLVNDLSKQIDKLIDSMDEFTDNAAGKTAKQNFKRNERLFRRIFSSTVTKVVSYGTAVNSLNIKCGKVALRWVEASLSKYKSA